MLKDLLVHIHPMKIKTAVITIGLALGAFASGAVYVDGHETGNGVTSCAGGSHNGNGIVLCIDKGNGHTPECAGGLGQNNLT